MSMARARHHVDRARTIVKRVNAVPGSVTAEDWRELREAVEAAHRELAHKQRTPFNRRVR